MPPKKAAKKGAAAKGKSTTSHLYYHQRITLSNAHLFPAIEKAAATAETKATAAKTKAATTKAAAAKAAAQADQTNPEKAAQPTATSNE
jgi:hypothetical protein